MFNEEISLIKESEEKADLIKKQAKIDSRTLLEESKTKVSDMIAKAQNEAADEYKRLIEEGHNIADKQYAEHMEESQKECDAMIDKARENKKQAIEIITERIGSFSVNN